ncbi:MAG: hypothetical protein NTW95_02565 [Candidatus Aminicenantes bacterium]|nr:hypothetical protein [Candidatus Aminicenantes bacterium]
MNKSRFNGGQVRQRPNALLLYGFLLALLWAGNPLGAQTAVDWAGIETAWNVYYMNPSEAGAEKLVQLLPGTTKILDIKDGFTVVNAISDHLGVLEGEIYAGGPNAVKLGFRLLTISYGAFEVSLDKILGNLISYNPKLFLEELAAHRNLFLILDPIVASFVNEIPNDPAARELEKNLRIKSLESVEDKTLKSLRNECVKLLKKL